MICCESGKRAKTLKFKAIDADKNEICDKNAQISCLNDENYDFIDQVKSLFHSLIFVLNIKRWLYERRMAFTMANRQICSISADKLWTHYVLFNDRIVPHVMMTKEWNSRRRKIWRRKSMKDRFNWKSCYRWKNAAGKDEMQFADAPTKATSYIFFFSPLK